jgi:UV DNA damage endonuclease
MEPKDRRPHLYQVARNNLKTVEAILRWNAEHGIKLYRITSELIPLATHPVAAEWNWEEDLAYEFAEVAAVARATGARLTTHPGQYTVLNAKDPEVLAKGVEDLVYHARMLELLETGPESGMVLHIGGAYGDKDAATARFIENFRHLPTTVADRLWFENDDMTWDTSEVLAIARTVGRPMVLDVHHHRVLREDDWYPWLEQVLPTWGDVRPKLHFSSPKDGARSRSHADLIDPHDFGAFLDRVAHLDIDVMLECKSKDEALLQLRTDMAAHEKGAGLA